LNIPEHRRDHDDYADNVEDVVHSRSPFEVEPHIVRIVLFGSLRVSSLFKSGLFRKCASSNYNGTLAVHSSLRAPRADGVSCAMLNSA
jgi:hypothetical protein